jgi:hypothetical protein
MQLRIDALLHDLHTRQADILAAIDADPLLIKRTSGDLVLANASKLLYTPTQPRHLYAKGIVYRRGPYRLVSLPLLKIYNVGERDVGAGELAAIASEPGTHLRFLRKLDGSLVQAFRYEGRTVLTTRGMIEGARLRHEEDDSFVPGFDFLAGAREISTRRYPALIDNPTCLEGRTLLFELIHPQAPHVTNYGGREDLVLHACFDHGRFKYVAYPELQDIATKFGLAVVDALTPSGHTFAEQIESLLTSLAGTDEEGSVVCFEREGHVTYRVKVKTPEYLRLMRLMAFCTYARTVELIDSSGSATWEDLKTALQSLGSDRVPEEVLSSYREHWSRWEAYLADLSRIAAWAEAQKAEIEALIGGPGLSDRKAYAREATRRKLPGLLFAALDGRLDRARLRKMLPDPDEAAQMP